jgi:hypothetical protein
MCVKESEFGHLENFIKNPLSPLLLLLAAGGVTVTVVTLQ